jgi:hypothetical protein
MKKTSFASWVFRHPSNKTREFAWEGRGAVAHDGRFRKTPTGAAPAPLERGHSFFAA